jgi:hypothetical protein
MPWTNNNERALKYFQLHLFKLVYYVDHKIGRQLWPTSGDTMQSVCWPILQHLDQLFKELHHSWICLHGMYSLDKNDTYYDG